MPRGGTPVTKDDLLIRKEETEARIQNLVDISNRVRLEVLECIDTIDEDRFVEVLEDYFLNCQTLEDIAEKRSYSVKYVGFLYGKGLEMVIVSPD